MARGHIRKRGNGYAIVLELPRDPVSGKRRQKWLKARTKREAEQLLSQALHELDQGAFIEPSTATVAEYLHIWISAIEATVRPSTLDRYERIVERQLIPALGSVSIARLSPVHVQQFYASCLQKGLSSSTVALYHGVLHRALDQAVKWRMITRNVCDAVDAPRRTSPEMETWTAEQVRSFLAGTLDDEYFALWRLAVLTGMRRGELLALRWNDIQFDNQTLSVRRTVTRGRDGLVFGEPKTKAARRSIDLPVSCIDALRRHRARQLERRLMLGDAWHDTDLIFDRGNGQVLHPNTVDSRFRNLVKRLGLRRIRFHDLRHTAASLMLENGTHPKVVQERLGHSDIAMTLNLYSHVARGMQREAADQLEQMVAE